MSDSPPSDLNPSDTDPADAGDGVDPDETAPQDKAPEEQGTAAPAASPGGLGDIEEGIAHLFASFERGVMNIAQSQGDKRRAAEAGDEPVASTDAETKPARAPRRGMTYEEALAPRSKRKQRQREEQALALAPDDEDEALAGEPAEADGDPADEPVKARPGMTYDEVLSPMGWRTVVYGFFAVVLLGALYFGFTFLQVWTSVDDDETQQADVVVVLGAAQFDGTPSPVLAARLDRALELWNDDLADFVVTTGSNQEGDRFTEGFSGFVYLREAGVPEDAILTIVDGADTYQQLSATLAQMVDRDLETALLVSDGYHSHRLRSIADEIGLQAFVAPTSIEATRDDLLRETTAVSIGRLLGYRRLSNWATEGDPPG